MRILRRVVILVHRYLGILVSLLFVIWFASAFAMIYTGGMPDVTGEERVARLPVLDLSSVRVPPANAVPEGFPVIDISLETLAGRPVYRLHDESARQTIIYADNGETLDTVDVDLAARAAAEFLGVKPGALTYTGMISEPDQWTLTASGELPMHKFRVNDAAETQIYVSNTHAKVSVYTTHRTRLLSWLGAIPHWFYLTSLRSNRPLWYKLVVWSSAAGCMLTILGLVLGVIQFRKSKPFSLMRSIPYRGWMWWHYVLGTIFGLTVLTWTFSGLLSMEPFKWTRAAGVEIPEAALMGGPYDPGLFGIPDNRLMSVAPEENMIKRIEFLQIWNKPYFLVIFDDHTDGSHHTKQILIDAVTLTVKKSLPADTLVERLGSTVNAGVTGHELITRYDNYYYSRSSGLPLPVLRIRFNDPAESWIYVDPAVGRVVLSTGKWNRLERWLFNGLHSLDFSFWYYNRPLWDIGIILLLVGGLGLSLIGFYIGIRRLLNDIFRLITVLKHPGIHNRPS